MKAVLPESLLVVELASVLAGPIVGSFFRELGAIVIKIENPRTGGDVTRNWRLPNESTEGLSAYYAAANYDKEVIYADLHEPTDRAKVLDLCAKADIVISNYNDRQSTVLGIDFETVKVLNENVIYCQLYAFSPEDERPGYDLIMQAETGFMMMNGYAEGLPAKMPVALIDLLAAHQMKESCLLALYHRAVKGTGSYIQVSLYQSAIAALANQATNYLMEVHIPERMGSAHPNIAPYGDLFRTSDDQLIMLAVGSDGQFDKLVKTLNFDHSNVSSFTSNIERVRNRQFLQVLLQESIGKRTYEDLESLFSSNAVPFCKLLSLNDVFEHPLAMDMILPWLSPNGQNLQRVSDLAFRFSNG